MVDLAGGDMAGISSCCCAEFWAFGGGGSGGRRPKVRDGRQRGRGEGKRLGEIEKCG